MEEEQKVELPRNFDPRVTTDTKFGTTKGQMRVYNEDLSPKDWEEHPKVTITVAEDLGKFQHGIIRIELEHSELDKESYLIQVDGLMSCVYGSYAKTLNNLRKATIRQKTALMYSQARQLWDKVKQHWK